MKQKDEITKLNDKIDDLNNQDEKMSYQMDLLLKEKIYRKNEDTDKIEELKREIENLNNNYQNMAKDYAKCDEENGDLLKKIQDQKDELTELNHTITGLELEKEIIIKQNEENTEKLNYFRQETLNQAGKRIKIETDLNGKIKKLEYDVKHWQYMTECVSKDRKHFTDLNAERWDEIKKLKKELSDLQQQIKDDNKQPTKICKCCDNKICNDDINCPCDTYGCGNFETCPKNPEMIKLKKFVEENKIKNVVSL